MSDRLLYILSAKGSMRHDDFYEVMSRDWSSPAATPMHAVVRADRRLEFVRFFEALGFCEVDWEKRKIFAVPPAWFLLPAEGLPAAVLIGGRSPALMKSIRAISKSALAEIQLVEHAGRGQARHFLAWSWSGAEVLRP